MALVDVMAPPWLRFPAWLPRSVAWSGSEAEAYGQVWADWLAGLSGKGQATYREWFPRPWVWPRFDVWGEFEADNWPQGGWGSEPVYTWAGLQAAVDGGAVIDPVPFWKPRPGVVGPACLGQWQPSVFVWDQPYMCVEQFMMAQKARLFGDAEVEAAVMASESPPAMKQLGRQVRGFDEAIWERVRLPIVVAGNYCKFSQDEALRSYLVGTGDRVLVEASPLDRLWGIGLGADSPRVADPRRWRGRNLLGFALMEVRDEIRRVWAQAALIDRQD